jgi:hypothetical protein
VSACFFLKVFCCCEMSHSSSRASCKNPKLH